MANYSCDENKWSEFQWEREIRRDERRISCYFRELTSCLDLPGEEEIIFSNLLSHPDLVPTGGNADSLRINHQYEEEDDEEDEDDGSGKRRSNSEIVDEIDHLATEWNVVCSSKLDSNLYLSGLGVVCSYGKFLARTADFIETDAQEAMGLKISLGKRALADLNDLAGDLVSIASLQSSLASKVMLHLELLAHIRERLIDLMELQRK